VAIEISQILTPDAFALFEKSGWACPPAPAAVDDQRPDEAALLQPLGKETRPGAVPVQALQVIAALAAKEEELTREGVGADHLLHLRGETIEAVPQIDRLTRQEHLRARSEADHTAPFIARKIRDSAFSFTKASTRTRIPFGRSISIRPDRSCREPLGGVAWSGDVGKASVSSLARPSIPIGTNSTGSGARAEAAAFQADRQL
jgi:hypothetical protein